MLDLRFFCGADPRGKQRARTVRRNGKISTYTPQETLDYERALRESFLSAVATLDCELPLCGGLVVDVVAVFARTKKLNTQFVDGTYKYPEGRLLHAVKPDEDNVRKCVCDAIGDYIEGGDSRIVGGSTLKVYGSINESTGTYVRIRDAESLGSPIEIERLLGLDWSR